MPHRAYRLCRSPYVCLRRCFRTTSGLRAPETLYEILQVRPSATPAEVKKSFYALSKRHHPDHNRDDPSAAQRFVRISDAYATLSIPYKRHEYDRSLGTTGSGAAAGGPDPANSGAPRRGSYASSAGPAGGRPASGLSRRRTQFRGPPPSFYRSGGWGAHADKRRAAQSRSSPGEQAAREDEAAAAAAAAAAGAGAGTFDAEAGGMGFGQSPFGAENDVRHFDREAHYRTQQSQERRRKYRMRAEAEAQTSIGNRGSGKDYLVLAGILTFIISIPLFMSRSLGI